jgi:hypothetical protein
MEALYVFLEIASILIRTCGITWAFILIVSCRNIICRLQFGDIILFLCLGLAHVYWEHLYAYVHYIHARECYIDQLMTG